MYIKAIPAQPAAALSMRRDPYAPIMAPTITNEIKVPVAPHIKSGRLPILSIQNRAGRVLRQLTMPYTPVARREV